MIKQMHFVTNKVTKIQLFEQDINNMIEQGWQPLGEVKIIKSDGHEVLMQQMVLEKK